VTGILVLSNPQRKYDKQLSLGEKYLGELEQVFFPQSIKK
jgi:hypothetical protein